MTIPSDTTVTISLDDAIAIAEQVACGGYDETEGIGDSYRRLLGALPLDQRERIENLRDVV